MRITYLHQYFTTPEGSGGTRSYEMGRRLVAAGHEVNIVSSAYNQSASWPRWSTESIEGMTVHRVALPYSNSMSNFRRIFAFFTFAILATIRAARIPADVIFATSTPLTIAIPGRVAAMLRRVPFVLEVRDLWPSVPIALGALKGSLAKRTAFALEGWSYRGANRIVTVAPGMKRHVESFGYPGDRIEVIPHGCNEFARLNLADTECIRSKHKWLGNRPLLVYSGTLGFVNGVSWLVEVAAQAMSLDPEIRFVVVGGGREYEAVSALARGRGISEKNFFMLGPVPKHVADTWVSTADAAISLIIDREYLWENAATNKFFDALSVGRPVLSNHPGYQTEVAVDSGAGMMLDQSNHALAAQQLAATLRDKAWLESASLASRSLARTQFNRDLLARRLEEILMAAVHEGNSARRYSPA